LGRYRVMELASKGGFGNVLVCWDIRLQRRVAIKCLPLLAATTTDTSAHVKKPAGSRRPGAGGGAQGGAGIAGDPSPTAAAFWQEHAQQEALAEARASSFLAHPNIVTVFDFETDAQNAYIVMEYVDGITLAELMARVEGGVLIWSEVAHLLESLSSALAFAHENGVLHLDIKPANVMIDRQGNVKLTDFGMASLASAAGWAGARGGTVGYMPPEQLTGAQVDERADIFSLATVCYQALCGMNPFASAAADLSLAAIQKGAPLLSTYEPELAGPAELAFMQALSPDPAARPSTVEEFTASLLPYLGKPRDGRASMVELLAQDEEEDFNEKTWRALDPPAARVAHLPELALRAVRGIATGATVTMAATVLVPGANLVAYILAACAAALAAGLSAGAAALIVVVTLVLAACATGITAATLLAACAVLGAGGLWLARGGLTSKGASIAVAVATLLGVPAAAPALAAYAATPVTAALTSGFATVGSVIAGASLRAAANALTSSSGVNAASIAASAGTGAATVDAAATAAAATTSTTTAAQTAAAAVTAATTGTGAAQTFASALFQALTAPSTWVALAGMMIAAAVGSALMRRPLATRTRAKAHSDAASTTPEHAPSRESRAQAWGATVITTLITLAATTASAYLINPSANQAAQTALEIHGVYLAGGVMPAATAVGFLALMCTVIGLFGPPAGPASSQEEVFE
jgi:serine/threonine-protein kinase